MTEARYIFEPEPEPHVFEPEPHVVEVIGERRNKIVKVIPSSIMGYRARLTTSEWDAMALCPRTAQRRFLERTRLKILKHTDRVSELSNLLLTCGRAITSYPVRRSNR